MLARRRLGQPTYKTAVAGRVSPCAQPKHRLTRWSPPLHACGKLDSGDPDQAALPRKWTQRLTSGDNTLADLIGATQDKIKARGGEAPARILLYLDQGEELYTR